MIAHKKAAETNVQKTERNTNHLTLKKEVARERENPKDKSRQRVNTQEKAQHFVI